MPERGGCVTPEERWSFLEARRLEVAADAQLREFMPDLTTEGQDLEAEFRDAQLVGDGALMDRVVDEASERGESWRHISWYEQLAKLAREEWEMALLRSATSSIKIAAQREFYRRSGGEADSP